MARFPVIRVPTSGPPALIAAPNDFATEAKALARIAEIEAAQLKAHHTCSDVVRYEGSLLDALAERGALF